MKRFLIVLMVMLCLCSSPVLADNCADFAITGLISEECGRFTRTEVFVGNRYPEPVLAVMLYLTHYTWYGSEICSDAKFVHVTVQAKSIADFTITFPVPENTYNTDVYLVGIVLPSRGLVECTGGDE